MDVPSCRYRRDDSVFKTSRHPLDRGFISSGTNFPKIHCIIIIWAMYVYCLQEGKNRNIVATTSLMNKSKSKEHVRLLTVCMIWLHFVLYLEKRIWFVQYKSGCSLHYVAIFIPDSSKGCFQRWAVFKNPLQSRLITTGPNLRLLHPISDADQLG